MLTIYFIVKMSETLELVERDDKLKNGIGLAVATIFLTGEMAGSGLVALPNSLVGTGTHY